MSSEKSGISIDEIAKADQNESSCLTDLPILCERKELEHKKCLAGLIFMCNKKTMKECFRHRLFGLPHKMWRFVKLVKPGMTLFLFEYESRTMSGIYEATSNGKLNIEESAYSTGSFPAQVRFKEVGYVVSLREPEFKDCIRNNYFTDYKFRFDLTHEQVNSLRNALHCKFLSIHRSILQLKSSSISASYAACSVMNDKGRILKNIIEEGQDDDFRGDCWSSSEYYLNLTKIQMNLQSLEETNSQDFVFQLETLKEGSEQNKPMPYTARLNNKPSVWSRLSTRIPIKKDLHFQKDASIERMEVANIDGMELPVSVNCDENIIKTGGLLSDIDENDIYKSSENIESMMQTDGISHCVDELRVSFKRKRLLEPSDQGARPQGKGRRKIARPDFVIAGQFNESPAKMGLHCMEPVTGDDVETLQSSKRRIPFEIDLNVCPSDLCDINFIDFFSENKDNMSCGGSGHTTNNS